ncbi:hypothetical protein OESDEN_16416 [Oesophagostomum dentatum]|uniref:Uncharacterized protein n=1 Tax=Oesophagostomum dentatum TaxID=61180 RepID=A0A0B1SK12_OESDE|nr:hypothetical protein OESDEN_16416 [Oesophagostomum dentatum]
MPFSTGEQLLILDQHSSIDASPTEDKHRSSIQSGNKSSGSKITTSKTETQKYGGMSSSAIASIYSRRAVTNSPKTAISTAIASGPLSTINAATAENRSITGNNPESDRITYGNIVTSSVRAGVFMKHGLLLFNTTHLNYYVNLDLQLVEQNNSSRTRRPLELQSSTDAAKINSRAKRDGDKSPASTTTNSKAETQEDGMCSCPYSGYFQVFHVYYWRIPYSCN